MAITGRQLRAAPRAAACRDWLGRDEGAEVAPGVAERHGAAVAEAGVPQQRQVDTLELGEAEVLAAPRLDVLHPATRHRE